MKWIRFADRKPPSGLTVLAYDVVHGEVCMAWYGPCYEEDGTPCMEAMYPRLEDDYKLAYWMPLPAEPNVEENEE